MIYFWFWLKCAFCKKRSKEGKSLRGDRLVFGEDLVPCDEHGSSFLLRLSLCLIMITFEFHSLNEHKNISNRFGTLSKL